MHGDEDDFASHGGLRKAARALAHELPLVTRNLRHFQRVPGLEIVVYD
ncbi:MAG TPA: hypothetical protein VKU40_12270 [Thermoanaerobaculia bacterium]|nr:hypothetical protein [Thermoanaerobaculia bacterium]